MSSYYDVVETPLGWMGLLASARGLRRTTLPRPSPDETIRLLGLDGTDANLDARPFDSLRQRLVRYLSGAVETFADEPIDVDNASIFSRAAWAACRAIPFGETRTYGWLAAQAGRARAPRAAGQTMARNRLPIVIPCHRVIASDGSLGGFGRGTSQLGLKQRLLDIEREARGAQ